MMTIPEPPEPLVLAGAPPAGLLYPAPPPPDPVF